MHCTLRALFVMSEGGETAPETVVAGQETSGQEAAGESKRKSRWGAKDEGGDIPEGGKKRSRWGEKAVMTPTSGALVPFGAAFPGAVPGMIPGLAPPVMTAEQQKVQARLNEIQRLMAQPK